MGNERQPLPQSAMIDRVRELCRRDSRMVAALMYGSFARGEGDAFSDIEFVFYFEDEALPAVDREGWVKQIAPLELFFPDAFGHFTAIFTNLIRGEFHFEPYSQGTQVGGWVGNAYFPRLEDCVIKDREGVLARLLEPLAALPRRDAPEAVASLELNFVNAVLFGHTVLRRGESARALELLGMVHRHLLWMARLAEGSTDHWPTPSRRLETELSPEGYRRFARCAAILEPDALERAYRASWAWGKELLAALEPMAGSVMPASLRLKLSELLGESG